MRLLLPVTDKNIDYLHIDNLFQHENVAIDSENVAIGDKNVAIETRIAEFNIQTKNNIAKLYSVFDTESIFGRRDISNACGISYSAAGSLISKLKKHKLIEEIKGHGKGKYRFLSC